MVAEELADAMRPHLGRWDADIELVRKPQQDILWISGKSSGPDIGIFTGDPASEVALVTVNEFAFDELLIGQIPEFVAAIFEKRARISISGRLLKWITLSVAVGDAVLKSAHRFKGDLEPWQVRLAE